MLAAYLQELVMSDHGLLSTVAYQLGPTVPPIYALEGAVSNAGQAMKWLVEKMELVQEISEIGRRVCIIQWNLSTAAP